MPFLITKCDIFLSLRLQANKHEAFSLPIFIALAPYRNDARFLGRHL